ncbi:hypothetical protein BDV59DRAFT_187641 [Aspergillus ambiguus]|uniref:uncharacterized protein n=1 Tax=Aspergillus ambiguus TaxID=176160 RepID=UPI003CCCC41D
MTLDRDCTPLAWSNRGRTGFRCCLPPPWIHHSERISSKNCSHRPDKRPFLAPRWGPRYNVMMTGILVLFSRLPALSPKLKPLTVAKFPQWVFALSNRPSRPRQSSMFQPRDRVSVLHR